MKIGASSIDFRNKTLDCQVIALEHQKRKKKHKKKKKNITLSATFYAKYIPFMLFSLGMSQDELLLTYH